MWLNISLLAALLLSLLPPIAPSQAAGAQVQIIGVNAAEHPSMQVRVRVRDALGRGVTGLAAPDFTLEEQGRTIPSELLQVAAQPQEQASPAVAIVADTSALLGSQALAQVQHDTRVLIEQLSGATGSASLALFVPRSDSVNQQLVALTFGSSPETMRQALDTLAVRAGQTDLYNAIAAAINASADAAAAHGGPAYVLVLGDGIDHTSIVGAGSSGANEAARLAEERHVQVLALGYGGQLGQGGRLLSQLVDRASGTYHPNPDAALISSLVEQIRAAATGGTYLLRYASTLVADGTEQTLAVRVQLDQQTTAAEARYLLPRPWDSATPLRMDARVDLRAYPQVTLWTRPVNRLRRTVAGLTGADFQLALNDAPLDTPIQVVAEPLDPLDPAASQSVALVIDLQDAQASQLRDVAVTLLQTHSEVPARVGLFVPGSLSSAPQFTHDHNQVINDLNQIASSGSAGGSVGQALLQAIEAVARNGDEAGRPAYVVLLAGAPLAAEHLAAALTLARDQGVVIHTVVPRAAPELARLAKDTSGAHLQNPDSAAVDALEQRIAADRATRYRITFVAPLLADGQPRTLTLALDQQRTTLPLVPLIEGAPMLRAGRLVGQQVLVFVLVVLLLLACAWLPQALYDRRARCPQCGRVRRATWDGVCLFCTAAAPSAGLSALALEGFVQQGSALAQGWGQRATAGEPAPDAGGSAQPAPSLAAGQVAIPPAPLVLASQPPLAASHAPGTSDCGEPPSAPQVGPPQIALVMAGAAQDAGPPRAAQPVFAPVPPDDRQSDTGFWGPVKLALADEHDQG